MLGVVLTEGRPLRLADLTQDPRSVGFPPHHPPMRSLLAVPVASHGRVLGNLYLTEKESAPAFDAADEETLGRFATQAALAIENARLHRQVRALAITEERERIAREMHDSLAQVLGYVNTKAQAMQVLLANNQVEKASAQLGQMADAARSAYADVREGILSLRTSLDGERTFAETLGDYLTVWQEQSGVEARLEVADDVEDRLPTLAEVQLLRIIQEALANIRKHAQATHALVRVQPIDGYMETATSDDGVGFAPDERGHLGVPRFGMNTMRERAESLGGTFDVASAPGEGTTITVWLPLERPRTRMTEKQHAGTHRR